MLGNAFLSSLCLIELMKCIFGQLVQSISRFQTVL